jgi:hypothetical protein
VQLNYPVMQFFDNKFFLPTHLYGVKVDKSNSITGIRMVHLLYQIPATEEV